MAMMRIRFFLLLVALSLRVFAAGDATEYKPPAPSAKVAILRETWHDAERDRDVPVKIYYPEKTVATGTPASAPVIVFSHGLGANCESYGYLGQHWAGCGYVSVHLQHPGSDDAIWHGGQEAVRKALGPENALNRVRDVRFGIDRVLALNADAKSPLYRRIDPEQIGVSGHSYGGWTTLAATGAQLRVVNDTLADPRIKAAVAMSPMGPSQVSGALAGIKVPVFEITGTRDDSPIGNSPASERRKVFDNLKSPGSLLVIFKDATHMTFVQLGLFGQSALDAKFKPLICDASTAFWDAHLRGNAAARDWLERGGFAKVLGGDGTFEIRDSK
jgi:predicted dienelactone hydrolase